MPSTASIPHFLLPQLTWRGVLPRKIPTLNKPLPLQTQTQTQTRDAHFQRSPLRLNSAQLLPARGSGQKDFTQVLYGALQASHTSSNLQSSPSLGARHFSQPFKPHTSSRSFSSTTPQYRDHHFDTLKFVQRLRGEGFSEAQATAMMRVLSDVIEEAIQNLTRTMVPREDAERATYTQKVDFTKLRSELLQADGTETQLTKTAHERLANDLAKLGNRLRDEVGRTQASIRLDLNLEKGRIREEANVQELKIKETEAKIEQEVAGLRERIEGVKFSTLQWLMGFCTGTAAIVLGAWRLLM